MAAGAYCVDTSVLLLVGTCDSLLLCSRENDDTMKLSKYTVNGKRSRFILFINSTNVSQFKLK